MYKATKTKNLPSSARTNRNEHSMESIRANLRSGKDRRLWVSSLKANRSSSLRQGTALTHLKIAKDVVHIPPVSRLTPGLLRPDTVPLSPVRSHLLTTGS